jgi:predicted enzyme related to lactoylglutathione lyase
MTYTPRNSTVWTEIPVTDLDQAVAFYSAATGMRILVQTDMGPAPIAVFQPEDISVGTSGHLYVGTPAKDGAGPTVHLAAEGRVEDTIDRVKAAGGSVISDIVAIPEGRFVYCQDPDGNSVSFFEVALPAATAAVA